MRILWFTWKDLKNPLAGGAEVMNEELAKRLVEDGHEVILLVGGYKNGKKEEVINGYKVVRVGGKFTVYLSAFLYYQKHLKGWADLIIEEINTIPFFTQFYAKEKKVLLIYQLCREIWFYQLPFFLSFLGYIMEPIYLWLLRNNAVLTESESTKNDLLSYGFQKESISIVPVGSNVTPIKDMNTVSKFKEFTILSFGSLRAMKRTKDQIEAFNIARKELPDIKLKIAGSVEDKYGKEVLNSIQKDQKEGSIEYLGKVSAKEKINLMQECHLIVSTSVKEGWGLTITEAATQGIPAVVYNVDGLRDSVKNNETGFITTENTPQELSKYIVLLATDKDLYTKLQKQTLEFNKNFTYDKSYQQFISKLLKYGKT